MQKHFSGGATCILAILISFASTPLAHAQADPQSRSENQPVAPFHIVGNIYYVGASDVTSFLIVTPAGDILLDGGFVQTAPQIEANIRKLGFKLSDVKILLNSHAHFDHCGGLAELKPDRRAFRCDARRCRPPRARGTRRFRLRRPAHVSTDQA